MSDRFEFVAILVFLFAILVLAAVYGDEKTTVTVRFGSTTTTSIP